MLSAFVCSAIAEGFNCNKHCMRQAWPFIYFINVFSLERESDHLCFKSLLCKFSIVTISIQNLIFTMTNNKYGLVKCELISVKVGDFFRM